MKTSIRQKLLLFFFIILACTAFIGYSVYRSNQKHLDSEKLMHQTEQVILQSANILSFAKDIETATRGFVITNDSSFLEPLFAAEKTTFLLISQLRQLTSDNRLQQDRVDSLTFYMHKRLDYSLKIIALRSKQGTTWVLPHNTTHQGKQYTDHLRRITNDIQLEEGLRLKEQQKMSKHSEVVFNQFTLCVFILMAVFTILLLITTGKYLVLNKEKEKRATELMIAYKELAFQNLEKEEAAAKLIVANDELAFQMEEKEKRAAELVLANKELAFQNKEKEKRAAEVVIANRYLKKAEDDIRKLNEELEQKVIERTRELELANKELESFTYSVSHDLRAPLRAVHGYARMLNEDYGQQLEPEATRQMDNIMNSAKKMGNLIDDLLTFSRIGRKELVKIPIEMNYMVKTLCNEINNEQTNHNIEFKINELHPARGDSSAIKQVWINLISNAVKYSKLEEKAVIEIGCNANAKEINYFIKDNGVGFDMRYVNKLFGMFQRLHSDDKFEGTGVGLAIVHRIISKHSGMVWADGKINQGAIFHFSLPKNNSA